MTEITKKDIIEEVFIVFRNNKLDLERLSHILSHSDFCDLRREIDNLEEEMIKLLEEKSSHNKDYTNQENNKIFVTPEKEQKGLYI